MATTNILDLCNRVDELEKKHDSGGTAEDTTYDNTDSGLTADTVQGAIDELAGDIDELSADDIDYDNTDSGLEADTVQLALDELAGRVSANDLHDRVSLAGYTVDNKYTCPTDGYVCLINVTDANANAYLVIEDYASIGAWKGRFSTFVRKGMEVWNVLTPDYVYFASV